MIKGYKNMDFNYDDLSTYKSEQTTVKQLKCMD
jgi:hypothetical protein